MFTVWKYPIRLDKSEAIQIPHQPKLLRVGLEYGIPYLWVMINTEHGEHIYWFKSFLEGDLIDQNEALSYIGAVKFQDSFSHVFKVDAVLEA